MNQDKIRATSKQVTVKQKKLTRTVAFILFAAVFFIIEIYSCTNNTSRSNDQIAWEKASMANDSAAYVGYLHQFPSGRYSDSAIKRLEAIMGYSKDAKYEKTNLPASDQAADTSE